MVDAPSLKLSRNVKYKVDTCGAVDYFNSMEIKHTTEVSAVQSARTKDETYQRVVDSHFKKLEETYCSSYDLLTAFGRYSPTQTDMRLAYAETDGGGK